MKRFLLFISILCIGILRLDAQCTVTNLAVELKSINTIGNECQVVFDFSWDQDVNNGNKFAYVHLWRSDQYPDLNGNGLAYTNSADYPGSADLANALATIVIDGNGTATPTIGTVYHPEATVPVLSAGVTVVKEAINAVWERMTVQNITLLIPACTGTGLTGDIWASQAENGKNVHCVSSNVSIIVGNPRIVGLLFCQVPRQYNAQISNVGAADITISYKVYIDEGDGVYEPQTHDLLITPSPVGPTTLTPGATYNSGIQSYLPWSNQKPYSDHGLWIEVTTVGFPNKTVSFVENTCIPLPVNFITFTAKRNQSTVHLYWETATESNNSGFEIQRQIGNGAFQPIVFIPTKAIMGNSEQKLSYTYDDVNPSTVANTYRIRQIDITRQSRFSEVRAVRGIGQREGILVYPNPITNGAVYVLFDNVNISHDIIMIDENGKIVKQWNNVMTQRLLINDMVPGIYTLRLVDRSTKEMTNVRIVVLNNR